MSLAVDICEEAECWRALASDRDDWITRLAQAAYAEAEYGPDGEAEVAVVLSDDAGIRVLNKQYRGKDSATNVLSFPAWDEDTPSLDGIERLPLGDVVLAYETVCREAEEQDKPLLHHVGHMVVHGILHLLGYDHEDEAEAEHMESMEVHILATFSIDNPYKRVTIDG